MQPGFTNQLPSHDSMMLTSVSIFQPFQMQNKQRPEYQPHCSILQRPKGNIWFIYECPHSKHAHGHQSHHIIQFYFLNTVCPSLSISRPSCVPLPAASSSRSHDSASFNLTASCAALTRMPHFSYIVIVSPGSNPTHLGMNTAASRGLPAWSVKL